MEGGSENENIAEKRRKGRTAADREEDKRRQCRATGSALSLGSRGIASDLLGRPRCWAAVVRSVRDTRFADDVSPVSPYPLLGEGERERTSIEGTDREEEEKSGQRECRCPMLWAGKRGRERGREGRRVRERARTTTTARRARRLLALMRCIASAAASTPARATRNTYSNSDRSGHTILGGDEGEKKRGSLAR